MVKPWNYTFYHQGRKQKWILRKQDHIGKRNLKKVSQKLIKRAKLFMTNCNSQRDMGIKDASKYVFVDRTKEPLSEGVQKILQSRKSSKITKETITEVLFNADCEYSFTSYSKDL